MGEQIEWLDTDLVRSQLADARAVGKLMFDVDQNCPFLSALRGRRFESPIEVVFCIWLEWLFMLAGQVADNAFVALPQRKVMAGDEIFRPDFIMMPVEPLLAAFGELHGCPMRIAVELDGHEFHERTKEQVALRDRRDRVLQQHGWVVFHISGSELVRTNVEAIKEVWLCAKAQLRRIREAVAKEWGASLKYSRDAVY